MAGLVKMAYDEYTFYLDKLGDPRVQNWAIMSSPLQPLALVGGYLYFTLFLGPRFMENRKPFQLNNVLIAYNAGQVLFSLMMFMEHLRSGWLLEYSYSCQPVDYSLNPQALRMANLCWWYHMSKYIEFLDTVFFILRKKNNQVSILHVYHHSLTPLITWCCVKWLAGGHGTFSNLLNNLVHVIMYSYYMVSAMGPQYHKYLWWKKHLTTIQLIQFTLVFVHSMQPLIYDCGYPRAISLALIIHSSIFFSLFFDFYRKAYISRRKSEALLKREQTMKSPTFKLIKQEMSNEDLSKPNGDLPKPNGDLPEPNGDLPKQNGDPSIRKRTGNGQARE